MADQATQYDIQALRDEIGRFWAEARDTANRHADEDNRRFEALTKRVEDINAILAEWTGSLKLLKWSAGLCLPLILAAIVTHLARHWNG